MEIETKFKTLIDTNGNYKVIEDKFSKGRDTLYKCSAPTLMGMAVTLESLKKCHPTIKFDGLELIIIEIKKDENNI